MLYGCERMKKMMALLTALFLAFQAALPVVYAEENGADSLGITGALCDFDGGLHRGRLSWKRTPMKSCRPPV